MYVTNTCTRRCVFAGVYAYVCSMSHVNVEEAFVNGFRDMLRVVAKRMRKLLKANMCFVLTFRKSENPKHGGCRCHVAYCECLTSFRTVSKSGPLFNSLLFQHSPQNLFWPIPRVHFEYKLAVVFIKTKFLHGFVMRSFRQMICLEPS